MSGIADLLRELDSDEDADGAWGRWLEAYAPILLQVAGRFAPDAEAAADCFLFQCERLHANRCARLRRFDPLGPASFPTWLRSVAINLSIDWHRARYGRRRPLARLAQLSLLHRETFRLLFQQRASIDDAVAALRLQLPHVEREDVVSAREELWQRLTPRQRSVALASGRKGFQEIALDEDVDVQDDAPDPEHVAAMRQSYDRLRAHLGRLPVRDRLVLRLRFEEELTLAEIARLTGRKDAQAVDRWIREVVTRLRREMT